MFKVRTKRDRIVRWLLTILSFGVSASILFWLVYRQKDVLLNYSWQLNPLPLLLSALAYSISLFFVIRVWSQMLANLGNKLRFQNHFRYYCISNLAKRLPGTVWYIAWRVELYRQNGLPVSLTSIASGIELAIANISGILMAALFAVSIISKYRIGIPGVVVLLAASLALIHPKVLNWLFKKFAKQTFPFSYRSFLVWILQYSISWIMGGIVLFGVASAIYPLPISSMGYVIGCWTIVGVLATALLFFPTNMGFNEIGISLLLSSIMPSSLAVVAAILTRIFLILFELGWALVALRWEKWSNPGKTPKVV